MAQKKGDEGIIKERKEREKTCFGGDALSYLSLSLFPLFLSILGGFQIGDPFRKKQMQGIGFGGRFFFF